VSDAQTLTASVTVSNVGSRPGKEVVQLYVSPPPSSVVRPKRELRGFEKIELAPGERKTVRFELSARAFSYWDAEKGSWRAETGGYTLHVGSSVRNVRASAAVAVEESKPPRRTYDRNSTVGDVFALPEFKDFSVALFAGLKASFGASDENSPLYHMFEALLRELPLRNLSWMGGGAFSAEAIDAIIAAANGKISPSALAELFKKK
jgi:beta-glucosidase